MLKKKAIFLFNLPPFCCWCMLLLLRSSRPTASAFAVVVASGGGNSRSHRLCHTHPFRSLVTTPSSWSSSPLFASNNRNKINGDYTNSENFQNNNNNNENNSNDEENALSDAATTANGLLRKTPLTGWNHNQPSETSKFWQGGADTTREGGTDTNTDGTTTPRLRTGWLHNTQPRSSSVSSKSSSSSSSPNTSTRSSSTTSSNNKNSSNAITSSASSSSSSSTIVPTNQQATNMIMTQQQLEREQLNHRLLGIAFHAVNQAVPLVVTEHVISVPLRHDDSTPQQQQQRDQELNNHHHRLDVHFTIVEKITPETQWLYELQSSPSLSPQERAAVYVTKAGLSNADGLFLFLQGGPGFGAPVPVVGLGLTKEGSWAAAALEISDIKRIVLLDQRGCGRSTPITKQWLEYQYPDLFLLDQDRDTQTTTLTKDKQQQERVQASVDQVVDYLSHFRCDSIVRDAELVREALLLLPQQGGGGAQEENNEIIPSIPRPWGGALGQSFGGFCLLNYLSFVQHPPKIALFTGGIPPMLTPLYEVYDKLWNRVKERSLRYYDMYPNDITVIKKIVKSLIKKPVDLPSGGKLTARRFLQLGLRLGSSPSAFAAIHNLLANAVLVEETGSSSSDEELVVFRRSFLKEMEVEQSFDDHPIYYWLHEPSCYADGDFNGATNWTAHRVYEDKKTTNNNEWDYAITCQESDPRPVLWFGEHVFPWMVGDYAELGGAGLAAVAEALAQKRDWGPLFHAENIRAALAVSSSSLSDSNNNSSSKCRAAAAVYYEDMYVEFDASVKVAARGAPLERCPLYITNEYQHSGLRDDGAKIFAKLYGMATGSTRTPS